MQPTGCQRGLLPHLHFTASAWKIHLIKNIELIYTQVATPTWETVTKNKKEFKKIGMKIEMTGR